MHTKLDDVLSEMILSASGWRGVFAESGGAESSCPSVSEEHKIIAAAAAKVFSDYLSVNVPGKGPVIVGTDTRPTGKAVAGSVVRALIAAGREVRYTGIAAAPEIMSFTRAAGTAPDGLFTRDNPLFTDAPAAGFMYISASHNPVGHNGIKFGLADGGVIQAEAAALLVSAFRGFMASPNRVERARALLEGAAPEKLAAVYSMEETYKTAAKAAYRDFTWEVISGARDKAKRGDYFAALRKGIKKRPLAIAADFNGSARTVSIDREFLGSLGAGFYGINGTPGQIVHRIVPEGESLDTCRAFVEEIHQKDPSCVLGYMPDCDGDRGNLVIWDDSKETARCLEAQEVFALACIAELASLVWTGELVYDKNGNALSKAAVTVNDPTSMRIDRIAGFFGAEVFRAEVGEANVVGLARKLRDRGYIARILGEGSSGGTVIHPSAVRDPIDTLGAILKLLAIRGGGGAAKNRGGRFGRAGLFEIWCGLSGQDYREDFTLADITASVPAFVTTGAYTEDALLKVKTSDHGLLKERYQNIFLREWEEKKAVLKERFGFSEWEAIAYNGTEERRGLARFGDAGRGGLKIEFFAGERSPDNPPASGGKALACVWMRGSGTEPVFRVMADAEGAGGETERFLIEWQRRMVREADGLAGQVH